MSGKQPVEVLLRPAVELYTVAACAGAAFLSLVAPWSLALSPAMGVGSALAFGAYGALRYRDARVILRYRRNIRRLPRYVMTSKDVPVSQQRLFVGRGFLWEQKHTHRLTQTFRPEFRCYVEPTLAYRLARRLEERLEFAPFPLSRLAKLTGWDMPVNPVRPLPPVGGLPRLHGIEPDEVDVSLPLGERVGHSLVLGTTRVGKTRLAELFVTQDIRRRNAQGEHEVVIVIDPKGDADLLKRMYVEAKRAGREGEFYIFHLGWPEISARYNAVGRFGRISEVATRNVSTSASAGTRVPINVHADEFNELMGDEFVPLINKGGGAGLQVTAYTQTLSDIEARIGNRAKAGQVIGNFNNLFMLRVRETATAELLTRQLPKVEVYTTTIVSGATDSSDIRGTTDFTSNTQDRISSTSVPMVEPSHIVSLPKGQCFALMQGGQLWKVRMPLPAPDPDEVMPQDLQQLAGYMRQSYSEASQWWENTGPTALQDAALPDDLLDDMAPSMGSGDSGNEAAP